VATSRLASAPHLSIQVCFFSEPQSGAHRQGHLVPASRSGRSPRSLPRGLARGVDKPGPDETHRPLAASTALTPRHSRTERRPQRRHRPLHPSFRSFRGALHPQPAFRPGLRFGGGTSTLALLICSLLGLRPERVWRLSVRGGRRECASSALPRPPDALISGLQCAECAFPPNTFYIHPSYITNDVGRVLHDVWGRCVLSALSLSDQEVKVRLKCTESALPAH
jgi:hypothetical protein